MNVTPLRHSIQGLAVRVPPVVTYIYCVVGIVTTINQKTKGQRRDIVAEPQSTAYPESLPMSGCLILTVHVTHLYGTLHPALAMLLTQ